METEKKKENKRMMYLPRDVSFEYDTLTEFLSA